LPTFCCVVLLCALSTGPQRTYRTEKRKVLLLVFALFTHRAHNAMFISELATQQHRLPEGLRQGGSKAGRGGGGSSNKRRRGKSSDTGSDVSDG
jgi:hypothetical protein